MKYKLLIIKDNFGCGGAEKLLIETLKRVDYNKYVITLLCCDKVGFYYSQIDSHVEILYFKNFYQNILVKSIFYRVSLGRRFILKLYNGKAKKILKNRTFDIALSYMEGPSSKIHHGLLAYAKRNVTWVHTDLKKNPWSTIHFFDKQDEIDYYKKVDEIVFVSEMARIKFNEVYSTNVNTRVVYNLIDCEEINKKACEIVPVKRKFTIVAVGRLTTLKRFDRLIRAAKIVENCGVDFDVWILGDGPLKNELIHLVESLNLKDVVYFYGFVSNPYPYIKASDIFVSSSDSEGFSLVVAEALCLGKAVISTAVAGPIDLLENGGGILVPADEKAIAEACRLLMTDTKVRYYQEMKAKVASSRFSVKKYMEDFYMAINGK